MPKLCLFFPDAFDDPAWRSSTFCLDAPDGDHGHGKPGEWIIGRHPAADVTIATRTVSARHCVFTYSYAANGWAVTDLNSTNGTRVNGELLKPGVPRPVAVGDRIHLGPNLINLVEHEHDTVGDDDGPSTVVSNAPIPALPTPDSADSNQYDDAVLLAVHWFTTGATFWGKVARFVLVVLLVATATALVALVIIH